MPLQSRSGSSLQTFTNLEGFPKRVRVVPRKDKVHRANVRAAGQRITGREGLALRG